MIWVLEILRARFLFFRLIFLRIWCGSVKFAYDADVIQFENDTAEAIDVANAAMMEAISNGSAPVENYTINGDSLTSQVYSSLDSTFTIDNQPFSNDLLDPNTDAYQNLVDEIDPVIESVCQAEVDLCFADGYMFSADENGNTVVRFFTNIPVANDTINNYRLLTEALCDAGEDGRFTGKSINCETVRVGTYTYRDRGMSTSEIIGLAVGASLTFMIMMLSCCFFILARRRFRDRREEESEYYRSTTNRSTTYISTTPTPASTPVSTPRLKPRLWRSGYGAQNMPGYVAPTAAWFNAMYRPGATRFQPGSIYRDHPTAYDYF